MRGSDVLILGGGVAGASLAWHLARGGATVTLLERHDRPGVHASGRNARLVLQAVEEPLVRRLVAASAREYAARAAEVGFEPCGSLLVGEPAALARRREPELVASTPLSAGEAAARVPLLAERGAAAALLTPGDGVLDPYRLLAWFLAGARDAGARVELGRAAQVVAGGRQDVVVTAAGRLTAGAVVDARGAWAGAGDGAGGGSPLRARKRHLFLLAHRLPPGQPYVWDVDRDLYFRADPAGTLVCRCDEEPAADLAETVSPGAEAALRAAFASAFPSLAAAPLVAAWSCFRTHSADGLPVLGPDPARPGWWWLAGLGGHGLSSAWETGRLVAAALAGDRAVIPPQMRADRPALGPPSPPARSARPPAPRAS